MAKKKLIPTRLAQPTPEDQAFYVMFDGHAAIMLLIEPQTGLILDANPTALYFYGYPQLAGMSITEINVLPPEQLAVYRQNSVDHTQNYFIFPHRLANGEERSVEVHSSPLTLQGRQVLFSIIHDITGREQGILDGIDKRAVDQENLRIYQIELEMQNHELRRSQELIESMRARYFDLYNLAPVGYCTLSPEGLILESNLTAAGMLGVTRTALIGKPFHRYISRKYQDSFYLFRKHLFETGAPQTCELQILTGNGPAGAAWVFLEASLALDARGPSEARLVISDISERKQAVADELEREVVKREQDVLARAGEERRILLDNIQTQIWYLIDDQTYGTVNEAHAAFIGVPKETLAFRSLSDFVPNETLIQYRQGVKQVFATGEALRSEVWMSNASGERRLLSILIAPILNPGDTIQQVICSAEDITERKYAEDALQQSEQRYRIVVEWSPYAVVIHRDGKIIYVNPAAVKMFGASLADELLGSSIYERIHPNFHESVRTRLKKALDEGAGAPMIELQYLKLDGTIIVAEAQGIPILYDGVPAIYAVLAEITESKRAEEALHYAGWQLESTIEGTHSGTWEWNVQTGETIFNEIWAQIVGYSLAELAPTSIKTWEVLTHPDDLNRSAEWLERHFAGELSYYDCELRMKHKQGHWVWIQDRGRVITWTADNRPLLMFGTHTDISERKAAEEKILKLNIELESLAMTDYLTNLFNRRYFMLRGAEELRRILRNKEPLALLMLDIDWFKKVNDQYGHQVGDMVLQHVALVLKSNLREVDFLGRIGGEEFAVLLPSTTPENAIRLAERVRQAIMLISVALPSGKSIDTITISIGVAAFFDGMAAIEDLLRNADFALGIAKQSGRNCVVFYQENQDSPYSEG
ncbi:MAG: PAS domain S-box protein [Chloroflexi bacterium]|nr:PAS domain S-box protein [Chloroflexota bacterium]